MWKWFLWLLGILLVWLIVAMALDHAPSGLIFGAAIGSATTRDPIFVFAILLIGLSANRPYQIVLTTLALAVVYTLVVSASIERIPISLTYIGRFLSALVWASLIAAIRSVVTKSKFFASNA